MMTRFPGMMFPCSYCQVLRYFAKLPIPQSERQETRDYTVYAVVENLKIQKNTAYKTIRNLCKVGYLRPLHYHRFAGRRGSTIYVITPEGRSFLCGALNTSPPLVKQPWD